MNDRLSCGQEGSAARGSHFDDDHLSILARRERYVSARRMLNRRGDVFAFPLKAWLQGFREAFLPPFHGHVIPFLEADR